MGYTSIGHGAEMDQWAEIGNRYEGVRPGRTDWARHTTAHHARHSLHTQRLGLLRHMEGVDVVESDVECFL